MKNPMTLFSPMRVDDGKRQRLQLQLQTFKDECRMEGLSPLDVLSR